MIVNVFVVVAALREVDTLEYPLSLFYTFYKKGLVSICVSSITITDLFGS